MLNDLEDVVQKAVDDMDDTPPLRADWSKRTGTGSVAEQILGVAATLKGVQQEIDKLQEEMIVRLNAIRKTLGSKA